MNLDLTFSNKARNLFIGAGILGLVLVVISMFIDGSSVRFWANYLLCAYYFTAISVTALAWIGINYISNAGWHTALKRIPEAMSSYLWVSLVAFAVLVIFSFVGHNNGLHALFEWMHPEHVDHDPILQGKKPYLNEPFFIIRMFLYFGIWLWIRTLLRKYSLREDAVGGLENYNKSYRLSAAWVPIYALTFCFAAWDWMMSLQPHWYSTIFGPYMFAGAFVSNFCIIVIIAFILKRNGYLSFVNENHFHDLGKFMFGFSIFWTYMWISQFLLIWYANLPEETTYYFVRMHGNWKYLFFANLIINFALPFLALMMRDSKRYYPYLVAIAVIMLCGRYIDWYLAVMPPTTKAASGFGLMEIGFFLFFAGTFAFTVAFSLAKAKLSPVNHPYFEESVHHEI